MTIGRRLFLASVLGTIASSCARQMKVGYWLGAFQCTAGLPIDTHVYPIKLRRFERLDLEEQIEPTLCWAAAIQSVLMYYHIDISQQEVVRKVRDSTGHQDFSAASLKEIIKGISGKNTSWYVSNGSSADLVQDLRNGNPVIIGLDSPHTDIGHVVVAYGVTYVFNYSNRVYYVDRVRVWDPWFGEGKKWLSGCDVKNDIAFALHSWNPG